MQVSHYLWPQDSAIEQMDVSELASGRLEARLYATPGLEEGSLALIPHQLKKAGYAVIKDSDEQGRYFLRVAGFKNAEELLGVMQRDALIPPPEQKLQSGEKAKKSFTEMLRDKAMNVAGLFAVAGHLSLLMSGFLRRDPVTGARDKSRMTAGATFATTNALAAWRGTGKKGGEVERIVGETFDKLKLGEQGVPDPRASALKEQAEQGSGLSKAWNTITKKPVDFVLNEHPYETGQVAAMLANAYLAKGSRGTPQTVPMRINALASLSGGLTLAFVPPKPHNAKGVEEAAKGPFGKIKNFLQDHNTAVGAFFMTVSNLAAAAEAGRAFKNLKSGNHPNMTPNAQRSFTYLAIATAACWFMAGGITAMGTKKRGRDYNDKEVAEHVSAMCAEVLLKTPEATRNQVINSMADYLGQHKEIAYSREEMLVSINKKLDDLSNSPWQQKVSASKANAQMMPPQTVGMGI